MSTSSLRSCPSDETLGALVERSLDEVEATRIGTHLDDCPECQDLVIVLMRARGVEPTLAAGTPAAGIPHLLASGTPTRSLRAPSRAPVRQIGRGSRIGRYVIKRPVGVGGMGIVYEAYDAELDRAIALKVLRHELVGDEADRLVRESRLMARVVHRSVITVYDAGRAGDTLYIAMELVRGDTLASYLLQPRPWREVVQIFEHAGQGLAAAHAAGVVHRDFKPENVLIETSPDRPPRVLVTDFGIARVATDADDRPRAPYGVTTGDVALTATGSAVGTPAYMAPEQHLGKRVDERADVFAFCASLWEALFGERAFPGSTPQAICEAMRQPPRWPRNRKCAPRRLVRVLQRGLAWDPAQRWPDMQSLLRKLRGLRARRLFAATAVAAIALVGIGVSATMAARSEPDPCAPGLAAIEQAFTDEDAAALTTILGTTAQGPAVIAQLADSKNAWRELHLATCRDRQPVATAACLEARRIEIAGTVDDLIADRGRFADELSDNVGNPAACAKPASGLLATQVPVDPALRRKVTAVRYTLYEADRARDQEDEAATTKLLAEAFEAGATLWPPLRAELLYMRGTVELGFGHLREGSATLREAAAFAEANHYDYVAASAWTYLIQTASFDDAEPARGLEYATYAEAAIARLAHPPREVAALRFMHGSALLEADRLVEGEAELREALRLSAHDKHYLASEIVHALAYVHELKGEPEQAVALYRQSLVRPNGKPFAPTVIATTNARIAVDLAMLGKYDEAEKTARAALEVASQAAAPWPADMALLRTDLVEVLQRAGKSKAALAELRPALATILEVYGDRSTQYAAVLQLEGLCLYDLEQYAVAERKLARACDILAFQAGPQAGTVAVCTMKHAHALNKLGRKREARALLDKAIPVLTNTYGIDHSVTKTARAAREQSN